MGPGVGILWPGYGYSLAKYCEMNTSDLAQFRHFRLENAKMQGIQKYELGDTMRYERAKIADPRRRS